LNVVKQGTGHGGSGQRTIERNQNLIARMAAPPTRAELLAQLDEELNEAIDLAVQLNERTTVRGLRMVRLELCQIRRREDLRKKG
jgi:hypothetical protein